MRKMLLWDGEKRLKMTGSYFESLLLRQNPTAEMLWDFSSFCNERVVHMLFKRTVFLLLALLLTVAPAVWLSGAGFPMEEPLVIWTASDLHYLSHELLGDSGLFAEPSSGGDGKAPHLSAPITGEFLAKAAAEKPDLLILSGDLTLNGAAQSHLELTEQLRALQEAGVTVLTMAGNHDIDGAAADYSTYNGETLQTMPALTTDQYRDLYGGFGWEQAISRDEHSLSYVFEAHPRLRILMLDANGYGKGSVKAGTFDWLREQLWQARLARARVIAVSHQNLYAHNEMLSFGYQLYNADDLLEVYQRGTVLCNLSGHIHVQSILEGRVPEVATGALSVGPCRFGELRYDGTALTYTAQETGTPLAEQASEYFRQVARLQVYETFAESDLPAEEIHLLAETFARINWAYFAGLPVEESDHAEGLALWQQQGGFVNSYLQVMLKACRRDNLQITIR